MLQSRLISALFGIKDIAKGTLVAGTKSITRYEGLQPTDDQNPGVKYVVEVYDTVGLGDGKIATPDILADILSQLPIGLTELHRVAVLCPSRSASARPFTPGLPSSSVTMLKRNLPAVMGRPMYFFVSAHVVSEKSWRGWPYACRKSGPLYP